MDLVHLSRTYGRACSGVSSGLAGDKVAQPYHGGPGATICVHMADH